MHELSIAENLISIATAAIEADRSNAEAGAEMVSAVHLRLGKLAGVEKQSLLFCFEIVAEGTPLAGARLVIEEVPVVIFCSSCAAVVELPGIQNFQCPRCGQPSSDVRQGREMELASIHFTDRSTADANL